MISVILFFGLLTCIHIGCQEKQSNDTTHNDTLQTLTKLCLDKEHIKYTRYVGMGTMNLVISLCILYLQVNH